MDRKDLLFCVAWSAARQSAEERRLVASTSAMQEVYCNTDKMIAPDPGDRESCKYTQRRTYLSLRSQRAVRLLERLNKTKDPLPSLFLGFCGSPSFLGFLVFCDFFGFPGFPGFLGFLVFLGLFGFPGPYKAIKGLLRSSRAFKAL